MSDRSRNGHRGSPFSGMIILGVGLYLLAVQSGYLPEPGESWPVFLIIVGLAMIFGAFFKRGRSRGDSETPPTT